MGIGGRGIGVPASPKPRPIPIQNLDAPIELPTSALRARYHPPTAGIARRGTRAPRPADGIGSWPAGRRQGPRGIGSPPGIAASRPSRRERPHSQAARRARGGVPLDASLPACVTVGGCDPTQLCATRANARRDACSPGHVLGM